MHPIRHTAAIEPDINAFSAQMSDKGWYLFSQATSPSLVAALNADLEYCVEICKTIRQRNGVDQASDGFAHHVIGWGESFLELLETLPLHAYIEAYFGGRYILNTLGGGLHNSNTNYTLNIHRDIRSYSGDLPLMLNTLVMLDDFTKENGAIWLMEGAQRMPEKPSDDAFYAGAFQATGKAGDVLMFDSNMWHAAGENRTDRPRRFLTPAFTRPFMKQQCDYPRVLGYDKAVMLSERLRQLLGYNARTPASLDEWYQPVERRMYQPGQG